MKTMMTLILLAASLTTWADLKPIKLGAPPEGKGNETPSHAIQAVFHFYATTYSPGVPTGTFSMKGSFEGKTRELSLEGEAWIKRPANYEMVPLKGKINAEGTSFTGRVKFDDCKEFVLKRTSRSGQSPIGGKWEGSYICAQGVTGLTLTIK